MTVAQSWVLRSSDVWTGVMSGVTCDRGGWLMSQVRVERCGVLCKFAALSSSIQNIGLSLHPTPWNICTLFPFICQVKFTQMSHNLQKKKREFKCFSNSWAEGNTVNRVSECLKKTHKKNWRVFPESLGFGQDVVVVLLRQQCHISCFRASTSTMYLAKYKTKRQKTNAHARLCFSCFTKGSFLQTCAGTNTSVNLQSVDPLSAGRVWSYSDYCMLRLSRWMRVSQ